VGEPPTCPLIRVTWISGSRKFYPNFEIDIFNLDKTKQIAAMAANISRKRTSATEGGPSVSLKKAKFTNLMEDAESDSDEEGGVTLNINEEYARRFEHNKKRSELFQCMFPVSLLSSIY
jgi:hypothetical protein